VVVFSSLNELPVEAVRDVEHARLLGIKSSLCLPLAVGGNLPVGALALNTLRAERLWPGALVKRLQLVAQIFANALTRKRAEEAFRAGEARLAAGTELAGLGYYEVNYGEGTCFLDDRFRDICGVPADVQRGLEPVKFWLEQVHPDDRQELLEQRQKLHDGRTERISTEYRYRHPGHGQKWIHHLARIAGPGTSGGGVRTFGVVRDITETRQLSERVQRAAEEWQTTFDSISDMVMILDREYRILRVNAACGRFFGLPKEKTVGSACYKLMHGLSCPVAGCPCQKTFATNKRSELEVFHEGSGKWLLLSTDPIQDATGNVIGVVHVGRDITEARRAERESRDLRDNLTHLTRVNTLGVLSGSLAHELNQPLGIILSNAQAAQELLQQEPPDVAEVQEILSDIVAADRRAGEVIERLRALLKRGQVSLHPLSLDKVIADVLQLMQADLIGRGITVVSELAPDLPLIKGDRVQLQQLLLNLILNAAEAMAANAPDARRLHLQTMLQQGRVRASLRDVGGGLPADVERLFEPFYTTKAQGLGMGLAICRSIVAAHHGRLWAEPHPERGAVFHFELPAASGEGQVASGSSEQPKLPSPTAASHRPPFPITSYERES
jgi:PAS domain S-box-containing protein